ncbi:hypothetical protein [Nitratidesulfovibrio vulgaris]|uniref:hypothetical protein n=1 Tax=Nitratidesulfovibrio vulgaris TaxID=881 RepID=UPI0013DF1A9D|nr:hypothetical protein [Nitratidesulfovibrio vulgaris]
MPRHARSITHDAISTDGTQWASHTSPCPPHLPDEALPDDTPPGFVLLDAITRYDTSGLTAVRHCSRTPAWHAVEAMAQAGAMHLRFLGGFSDHAFLLGITDCPWPETALDGCCRIEVRLTALTQGAASYDMTLSLDGPDEVTTKQQTVGRTVEHAVRWVGQGAMLFGRVPYDNIYREAVLAPRYRRLFAWLTRSCTA